MLFFFAATPFVYFFIQAQRTFPAPEPVVTLPEPAPVMPLHLSIPALQIEAAIQQVGVTPEGAMAVPTNITDVGWFKDGTLPGGVGSAVISGHLNGENNEVGVFARLRNIKVADMIYITSDDGSIHAFQVRMIRNYEPGRADEVFTQNDTARLNLITCEGGWDPKKESYNKRLVVFSELVI